MGEAIPRQHPAVVLRSHFNHLRALLAVAMIAVVGLTAAVVILATDDEISTSGSSADALSGLSPQERIRVEALSSLSPAQLGAAFGNGTAVDSGTRYDGGPEEGTRGAVPSRLPNVNASPSARYDGGPEEGAADVTAAELPRVTQQQAFPGLAGQARDAQSPASSSQSGTKDYSQNGATGDYSTQPEVKSGSRADGGPEEGSHLR
jgi:hypothetical protein